MNLLKNSITLFVACLCCYVSIAQVTSGTVSPSSQSIGSGVTPTALTATAPSNTCGSPSNFYLYQWQVSTDNASWTNISGATSGSGYSPGALTATRYYRLYTQNSLCQADAYSNVATVTVVPFNAGTISAPSTTIYYNRSPGLISGTSPAGGTGAYSYQWLYSTDGIVYYGITGATGATYTPGNLTTTTYFRRQVTSGTNEDYSNTLTITVYPELVAWYISPEETTIYYNTSPIQFSVFYASGGNYTYAYQWYSSTNNVDWLPIAGASQVAYAPPALTTETWFKRCVKSGPDSAFTNAAHVIIVPLFAPGTISPVTTAVNYGAVPSVIIPSSPTGTLDDFSYQWQRSEDSIVWHDIAGAVDSSYSPGAVYNTAFFRRNVSSLGITLSTNDLKVIPNPILQGGIITPGSISITANTSPGTLGNVPATGGNGSYSYSWYSSGDGISWTAAGITTQNYSPGNLTAVKYFKREVYSGGDTATSSVIKIAMLDSVATAPAAYSDSMRINYIRIWEATSPQKDTANFATKTLKDVKQSTEYFDGLGRKIQAVMKQGSLATGSAAKDLVLTNLYDTAGRESLQYLPFAADSAGGNTHIADGLFKRNAFAQQAAFNSAQFSGEDFYYGRSVYEQSPLNRVLKTMAAGKSWTGSNLGTEMKYWTNTSTDDVKKWTVTNAANNFGSYAVAGAYGAGALYKMVTVDEHGNQAIDFKDKEGKIILRKLQNGSLPDTGTGKSYMGWDCTYYMYDSIGNLRCVIQPNGVASIAGTWTLTDTSILNNQCFRYEFDYRNRQVRRKNPGAGAVYIVYDKWDRQVLTQNANQRALNQWSFMKYDALNRPAYTGLYSNNTYTTLQAMQACLDTTTLVRYEDYLPAGSMPLYSLDHSFPVVSYTDVLTVSYYDNYQWTAGVATVFRSFDDSFNNDYFSPDSAVYPYPQPVRAVSNTIGLLTGTIIKSLDSAAAMVRTHFYDQEGRTVQAIAGNYTGGTDITTTQYSFSGQPLVKVSREQKAGTNPQTHTITTVYNYDDLNRLSSVKKLVESNFNGTVLNRSLSYLSQYEYNELGRQKAKRFQGQPFIGSVDSYGQPVVAQSFEDGLENMNYSYNIRGWLLGGNINYVKDLTPSTGDGKYFGFELAYDKPSSARTGTTYATQQFNGNIAGTLWKSAGDGEKRKYDYLYDKENRLLASDFNQLFGSAWSKKNPETNKTIDYSIYHIAYDANSNILALQQNGWKPSGSVAIDHLQYTYQTNSNRLAKVTDAIPATGNMGDFKDGANETADDYMYDANGNMVADSNKAITGITYNHLNLAETITIAGKGTIRYTWDALGNKIKKVVSETGKAPATTLYLGSALYQNDTLQYISHEEGRLRYTKKYFLSGDSTYNYYYDFFVKDQVDNVRMVLTEQADTTKYLASLETAYRSKEEKLFGNIASTAVAKSTVPGYPSDGYPVTSPSDYIAQLDGNGNKVGPSLVLKVMGGDVLNIAVKSYYKSGGTAGDNANPLADILYSLATGITGIAGELKGTVAQLGNVGASPALGAINSFSQANNPDQPTKPKAYLNWVLFDEQFNYVADNFQSYALPVGVADSINILAYFGLNIKKNGFLYVFVSNETKNWKVYFDDLSVTHYTGPILQEDHYYPFGLTMNGLSSKAFNKKDNLHLYNTKEKQDKEFSDGTGLAWYDFGARMYDAQIGRFFTQDRFSEKYLSLNPYQYAANNPILYLDNNGDSLIVTGAKAGFEKIVNNGLAGFYEVKQNETGTYSLVRTTKEGELTEQQKSFYNSLNGVLINENTITIKAVENSADIDIGSQKTQTMDVGDMLQFNSIGTGQATTGSTAEGLLIHEVVEEFGLQTSGVDLTDEQAVRQRFKIDHPAAIAVENAVNGNTRDRTMEIYDRNNRNPLATYYSKFFLEKKGTYTIESTVNQSNPLKINKLLNQKL